MTGPVDFDLAGGQPALRKLNQWLHARANSTAPPAVRVLHPDGAHNIAVGADAAFDIDVLGHAGYLPGRHEQAGQGHPCMAMPAPAWPRT